MHTSAFHIDRRIRIARRIGLIVAVSTILAVGMNLLRPAPLPWLAAVPYEIYRDCPERMSAVATLDPRAAITLPGVVLIDARPAAAFAAAHCAGARNLPYDPLFPLESSAAAALKSAVGTAPLVVYGEGPEASLLADELTQAGIDDVRSLSEGFSALKKAGCVVEGSASP